MNMDTSDSNPLFNPTGTDFRPSLYAIPEDLRESREASSYFRDEGNSIGKEEEAKSSSASSSGFVSTSAAGSMSQHKREDKPQLELPQRRLSAKLPSLSRMIRTPSGRGFHTESDDPADTAFDDRRMSATKKRASLLQLFKGQ